MCLGEMATQDDENHIWIGGPYKKTQQGDMVDWLKDGCYWSGTITKLLKNDMVKKYPIAMCLRLLIKPLYENNFTQVLLKLCLQLHLSGPWKKVGQYLLRRQTKKVGILLVFLDTINQLQLLAPPIGEGKCYTAKTVRESYMLMCFAVVFKYGTGLTIVAIFVIFE
ncbi:hypothetical protein Zm00014a_036313 [Zea mays]|uniref:Uncharacterized protein n=1 Tax=Zea mays TaxID=4577 RepID=A0A3L6GF88_MAIZE|nr:hypothetical protein Zm00014a_036313 [Zea mays]